MQHSDITLPIDNGTINIRVGAIIMKDGKFLMTGNPRVDYLYSVGGRGWPSGQGLRAGAFAIIPVKGRV